MLYFAAYQHLMHSTKQSIDNGYFFYFVVGKTSGDIPRADPYFRSSERPPLPIPSLFEFMNPK